ncbi:hypothetical protein IFM51744_03722 [Aspergillus udagawae]|nr:hypothetical protein IFM51744_03722 [Aspergillus udagawae]GFG17721.1 hypothetical protein IFM5058_08625 [Aspergillus udagawae]
MLLKTVVCYLAVGASCALAATNTAAAISDMDNLARAIRDARDSLYNYQGGLSGALDSASAVSNAKLAARTARESLASSNGLTPDEATKYYEAYTKMSPVLLDALTAAKDKAPLYKEAGLGPQARETVQDLHNEKKMFQEQANKQIPEETMRKAAASNEQISKAFDEAEAAFLRNDDLALAKNATTYILLNDGIPTGRFTVSQFDLLATRKLTIPRSTKVKSALQGQQHPLQPRASLDFPIQQDSPPLRPHLDVEQGPRQRHQAVHELRDTMSDTLWADVNHLCLRKGPAGSQIVFCINNKSSKGNSYTVSVGGFQAVRRSSRSWVSWAAIRTRPIPLAT